MISPYAAAHQAACLFDRSVEGRIELVGRDRLDLLHRMSTNDLLALKPGEGCSTVLTTALARIIDRLIVYHRGETALAVCGVSRVQTVRAWLQRHIFFQDQVKTRDVSEETFQFTLCGTAASTLIEDLAPGTAVLPLHHFVEVTPGGFSLLVARTIPLVAASYSIIGPLAAKEAVWQRLCALENVVAGTEADYELLRIESGIPEAGHELTEDYIPLEAGLWDSVSFKKGCYIGQEIIARMESRNKLAKTLTCFRLPQQLPAGTEILQGTRGVGSLTSVAALPTGETLALGYIRTEALEGSLTAVTAKGTSFALELLATPHR